MKTSLRLLMSALFATTPLVSLSRAQTPVVVSDAQAEQHLGQDVTVEGVVTAVPASRKGNTLTLGSVQAENMRHDRLVALLSDPGSDLSGLKGDYNLQAAATLDARLYFKKHNNRKYGKDCLGIGLEHAVKHHLKGRAVDVYALAFDAACSAFFAK